MKICFSGSRNITNINLNILFKFLSLQPTFLISGDARGLDSCVSNYAKENNIIYKGFPVLPVEWNILGKRAGMIRNATMIKYCELIDLDVYICIFYSEKKANIQLKDISSGTRDAYLQAKNIFKTELFYTDNKKIYYVKDDLC